MIGEQVPWLKVRLEAFMGLLLWCAARPCLQLFLMGHNGNMITHLFKNSEDKKAITGIVNTILRAACRDGASQIFFEPHHEGEPNIFQVNFKVKEEIQLWLGIPKSVLGAIVSHLQEIANMKTSNEQGIIPVRMKDRKHGFELNYDLRVEISVTPHGERVTLSFVDEEILN